MKFVEHFFEFLKTQGVDANTTATIFITVTIFLLGLIFTGIGYSFKNYQQRQNYRRCQLLLFKDFVQSCKRQHEIVSNSLRSTGLRFGNDFNMSYIRIGTLHYLSDLNFNELVQNFEPLFFGKRYSKLISKLIGMIAQVKAENDTIFQVQSEIFEIYKRHEREYQQCIQLLRKTIDQLRMDSYNTVFPKEHLELIQGYFNILDGWAQAGKKVDMYSTYSVIVLKILALNKNYPTVPLILTFNDLALRCDLAYRNIEKTERVMYDRFRSFAFAHRRAAKVVGLITEKL